MKKLILVLASFCLWSLGLSGLNQERLDSLKTKLAHVVADSSRIGLYLNIAEIYLPSANPLCIEYAEKSKAWSEKTKNLRGLAGYHNLMGRWHQNKGFVKESIMEFEKDIALRETLEDTLGIANAYNNLGSTLTEQGRYNKALVYHLHALDLRTKIGDEKGEAFSYHNIAMIYDHQKKYDDALENYLKSLVIKERLGLHGSAANSLLNIGLVYLEKKDFDTSLAYSNRALTKYALLEDSLHSYFAWVNIAWAYMGKGEYNNAVKIFNASLSYGKTNDILVLVAFSQQGLGEAYLGNMDFIKSLEHFKIAESLFLKMGAQQELCSVYKNMSEVLHKLGKSQEAYLVLLKYHKLNDSLLEENNEQILAEMQEKYESAEKERSITLLTQENKLKHLQRNIFIVIGVFLVVLAGFMYKNIRDKIRANRLLQEKNNIISEQKDALEKQRNSILDSIKYAKRIQESFLIPKELIYQQFEDAFVLYKPRDIVSGDFYWYAEKNGKLLLAAVDCTGHGVPGALMSMLGNRLLNEIVLAQGEVSPGKILEHLHSGVVQALQQTQDSQSQDGMDMFICSIDRNTNVLEYSGAVNPALLVENGELITLKSTFLPIGGVRQNEDHHHRQYETFRRPIVKNTLLYLFSDGYVDQFNGKTMKKFGSSNLKKFVEQHKSISMKEQLILFEENLEQWKEGHRQMDDVLMMGVRLA